jgi:predicted TIM-barrel fold metal-dependent hydrolase
VAVTLAEMDHCGVAVGMVGNPYREVTARALREHPDRFVASLEIDPNDGIPGPRLPGACQDVMHFDQVCFDFPELRIVMRHGAEPWEDLAVKLMLKWPGLHYMTSGFAPRYYPRAIIDYANTRGAETVLYAGYYPMGLSLRRIFDELAEVPLKDEVWPLFLRENARRVFKIEANG